MAHIHAIQTPTPTRHPTVSSSLTIEIDAGTCVSARGDKVRVVTSDGAASVSFRGTHADLLCLAQTILAGLGSTKTEAPLTRDVPS